jgi:hypothetical protein
MDPLSSNDRGNTDRLTDSDSTENGASNNSSIFASVFVTAVMFYRTVA